MGGLFKGSPILDFCKDKDDFLPIYFLNGFKGLIGVEKVLVRLEKVFSQFGLGRKEERKRREKIKILPRTPIDFNGICWDDTYFAI